MRRLVAALVILLVGFAPASLAQAQIGPNVPEPLTEPPPAPPPAPNPFDDDGGLSTLQKVLIFGAAALVLGAIATVIVRDARKAAPPDERPRGSRPGAGAGGKRGTDGATAKSTAERKRQQRAKRAKAKHARQQRKRNRPH